MCRRAALQTRDLILLGIAGVLILAAGWWYFSAAQPERVPDDLAVNIWFKCEACKESFQYSNRELAQIIQAMPGGGPRVGQDLKYAYKKCGQKTAVRDYEK